MSHAGAAMAALLTVYGVIVAANLALTGDRGGLRAPELLLLLALVVLAVATDLTARVARALRHNGLAVLLLGVLAHFLISAVRAPRDVQALLIASHLPEIVRWFLIGFIAMSGVRPTLRLPLARRIGSIATAAAVASAAMWGGVVLILLIGRAAIRTDIFQVMTGEVAFYQVLGDYYTVAAGIVLGLQAMWFRAVPRSSTGFAFFMLFVAVEGVASFFLLQLFGSNKAPVVVLLMCGAAVLVARPDHWLFVGTAIRKRAVPGVAMLAAGAVVALAALASMDIPPMRIFGFGDTPNVLGSSSVTSRNEFLLDAGAVHLLDSPVLGNISLGVLDGAYLHSSVLSTQTHLGVVGTLLLGLVLFVGWRRVRGDGAAGVLRVTFWPILLISAVSSFFTWGPLWFVIGGIAAVAPGRPAAVPPEP